MFRTIARALLPNHLDWICKRAARRHAKKILLAWNRGLGDIALGLYAIVYRIREWIPDAEITFLIRADLRDGFTLLNGVNTLIAPDWVRGKSYDVKKTLCQLGRATSEFDRVIGWPDPSQWVRWQQGRLVPRLTWNPEHDTLCQYLGFAHFLDKDAERGKLHYAGCGVSRQMSSKNVQSREYPKEPNALYVGVQPSAETHHGPWRNWPPGRWQELFDALSHYPCLRVMLFGFREEKKFFGRHLIDLRGRTTLFEMLSLIKNRCSYLIVPDSGILSMIYYLDTAFPLQVISLWADPNQGVLKQNVASPNPLLAHSPLIGSNRDLSTITCHDVIEKMQPLELNKVPLNKNL
jgi:ADP-heptose:LPS heptosyltransferase